MAGSLKSNVLLGLAGGLAATAAMNAYWMAVGKLKPDLGPSPDEENTTERVARRILKRVGVKRPSSRTRAVGGEMVHWSYGASWGLAVGLARSAGVRLDWGGGQLLGAGMFALGDEWMTYQLGLAKHPREVPLKYHASALGAHLVYGLGMWAAVESLGKLQPPRRRRLRRAA